MNETDGGRLRSPVIPKRLINHIRGPGNLIIFRGEQRIATLLNGKLQGHGFHLFEAGWLRKRQEEFAGWAIHFAVMRRLSVVGAEHGMKTVGWKEYQELKDDQLAELDEAIFEPQK